MSSIRRLVSRASIVSIALLGVTALISACALRHAPDTAPRWTEARQCPFHPTADVDSAETAVKCAEEFIARNGYTLTPPVWGSAQLAEETFETGQPWSEVLARRRGTLKPKSVGVCVGASDRADMVYTVAFPYADNRVTALVRVVTMTASFGDLRMQHQDVRVRAMTDPDRNCQFRAPEGQ